MMNELGDCCWVGQFCNDTCVWLDLPYYLCLLLYNIKYWKVIMMIL